MIVRHLLLPGHLECCLGPIVEFMREELPQVLFSLRDGYLPSWRAGRGEFVELGGRVSRAELHKARSWVAKNQLLTVE